MWLLIAIGLIIIIGMKTTCDKARGDVFDRELAKEHKKYNEWAAKYTSLELESRLVRYMDDPKNQSAIWEEVSRALNEMDYWKAHPVSGWKFSHNQIDYSRRDTKVQREYIDFYRKVAKHIMLANRGKVDEFGIDAHIWFGEVPGLTRINFELAEWIQNTLKKQGVDLKLYYKVDSCGRDEYVWDGSLKCKNNGIELKEFSRELLAVLDVDIPSPYYK